MAITILGSNPIIINKTPKTAPGEEPQNAAPNEPKKAITYTFAKLLLSPVKSPGVNW